MQSSSTIYKVPFSRHYWRDAINEFKDTKKIALASIFISMTIILETFGSIIPLTFLDRKVLFSFVPVAISAMLCGPLVSLVTGFISDILGFFITSTISPMTFFPGYTLSAMLGALIYSLFLYRSNISVLRITLAKLCVNLIVNAFLGAIWLSIMYGKKPFLLYLSGGLIKNIILLPIEIYFLMVILHRVIPLAKMYGLISIQIDDRIKII